MTRRTQSLEEQLLHIIDRVERGTALADEITRLRAGIRTMAGAQRSSAGLQAALQKDRATIARVREVCDRLRAASVLADGQPHTDRERGVIQAVDRVTAALDGRTRQCRRCLCPADQPACTHCNTCDVPAAVTP